MADAQTKKKLKECKEQFISYLALLTPAEQIKELADVNNALTKRKRPAPASAVKQEPHPFLQYPGPSSSSFYAPPPEKKMKVSPVTAYASSIATMMGPPRHDASETANWLGAGLSGPFFPISIRKARLGSYEFTPIGRVLISEKGIYLKVPILSASDGKSVNVVILTNNICCVKAYFSRASAKSTIFVRASQPVCRSVSQTLGLKESSGPYWDGIAGKDETRKWLMMAPDDLDKDGVKAVREAFGNPRLLFSELSAVEAKDLKDDIRLGPRIKDPKKEAAKKKVKVEYDPPPGRPWFMY